MLKVKNLSKVYTHRKGEVAVLKGVSFEVGDGEIIGLVGRSGGGKSTLMKILRGVESFDGGEIIMDGLTVKPDSDGDVRSRQLKMTAIHLQRDFGLWTESALNNVVRRIYSRKTGFEVLPSSEEADYDEIYEEAMGYLKLVGLGRKAKHLATILSGGEKQRLLIARQLAKKPKLLLLDEPATMACPATKQEVLDTIKRVRDELDITVVVVSHLPEVHEYLADRLIWIDRGLIRAEGDPGEVLSAFLTQLGPADPLPPRPEQVPEIMVDGLCKRNYLVGTGVVLKIKDMSFTVNGGEITSLIGSSGAGKTTILKIIQGLAPPDEGTVLFKFGDDWVDMTTYSPLRKEVRRTLGIMYQEFALSPGETILEQIGYQLGVKGTTVLQHAREVAEEMGISDQILDFIYTLADMSEEDARGFLESLGLTKDVFGELFPRFPDTEARKFAEPIIELMDMDMSVLNKLPEQLSGGEQVRASLAILLAAEPKVMILDEPFGDIDPVTLREVSNALKRITAEFGTTIFLVSHHVDFVREISHRAILIDDGAVVADGSAEEVCDIFISRCGAAYLKDHRLEAKGYVPPARTS